MQKMKIVSIFLICLVLILHCESTSTAPKETDANGITEDLNPFEQNALLGRSINLGNALEAPQEGAWGVTLDASYFQLIKEKGFDGVRIPIRWSAHAEIDSPFTINKTFFSRVDWAIEQALQNNLTAVINIHHYVEIASNPEAHKQRFLGLWSQIAERYANKPKQLFFEILNEPNDKFTPALWNVYLDEAIDVIRQSNPRRTLIVGTAEFGGLSALEKLILPEAEQNLIVTFHYYNPFHFTHQGAEWVSGSDAWLGTTWHGTNQEKIAITMDFDNARIWAQQNNRPLFMGEFGAYSQADMLSRFNWTNFVSREAEKREFSWAYWEFCAGFGIYDSDRGRWNELLDALIP